ncbi:MAG: DegV family EDD domain-containing protein [Erysipelotrichaceae bacterium]|jgi:DegV family protein with EDD domain|nr:DegV family EDD domain-containing protein [Erysipelotrichaceae bacterium]
MKIGLSAESAIDLPKELLEKYNIKTVAFTIVLGEKFGFDGEITQDDIFAYVDETGKLPKTCAVNEHQYHALFEEMLKEYDEVIHFAISSKLSSAYENALRAAASFNGRVHVIDTEVISGGIALLAITARDAIDKGESVDSIIKLVEEKKPLVQITSVLNGLDYLYKGGRCSALARFGANLFKIRPEIIMKDGKMTLKRIYRGKDEIVVKKYCADVFKDHPNINKKLIIVASTNYSKDIVDIVENKLKGMGFEEIIKVKAGSTISSYCGDKSIGMLFMDM